MRGSLGMCLPSLVALAIFCACSDPSLNPGDAPLENGQVVVENRVKLGKDSWVIEFGDGTALAEPGAVVSIEIVNDSGVDQNVEGAGLNKEVYKEIFNGCTGILKAGASCAVRGQLLTQDFAEAKLEVAVSSRNEPKGSTTEKISVPLELGSDTPSIKTLPPTPAPSSESPKPSPSPSTTTSAPHSPSPGFSSATPTADPTRSN